jgi:hypothetical protein
MPGRGDCDRDFSVTCGLLTDHARLEGDSDENYVEDMCELYARMEGDCD